MPTSPLISVVVPVHNSAAFLPPLIASIRAQSFTNWECVLIDDGSRDGSAELAHTLCEGDARFKLVRQSAGGSSLARNRGFFESSPFSEFVTFMDADDVWQSDALEVLLARLQSSPTAVGAHGLADFIGVDGGRFQPGAFRAFGRRRLGVKNGAMIEWPREQPTTFETLMWTGPLYPPGVLLARRVAYEKAGLFDMRLKHCEDWDMALRLSRLGVIEFVDKVILGYRRHSANASNDRSGSSRMVRHLYRKTFFAPENTPHQRELLREGWRAWQRYKIREKWAAAFKGPFQDAPRALWRALLSAPVHAVRSWRGYPSESGI